MFTLAISCLTTYYLPWFMDLIIQVPMQYCSFQHRTLLPSPVNIQKTKKQWKQWQTLFVWAPKITAIGNWSHEITRRLLLGRKAVTNLDSVFKSRDISFPTKFHLVKVIVFLVVMYGCESWTIKMLSTKELMLLNCGVGVDSWESLGLQGDPTSQS